MPIFALVLLYAGFNASGIRILFPRRRQGEPNPRWLPILRPFFNESRCQGRPHDEMGNCICAAGQGCRTDGMWGNGASPVEVAWADSCPVAGNNPGPPARAPDRYHANCETCVCFDLGIIVEAEAAPSEHNGSTQAGIHILPVLTNDQVEAAIATLYPEDDQEASQALRKFRTDMREKIKEEIYCPILQEPMRDPVVIADGNTYERSAITMWFQKRRTAGEPLTSPLNGAATLDSDAILPNLAVRKTISVMFDYVQSTAVRLTVAEED